MNAAGYADLLAKGVAGATGSWPTPRGRSRSTRLPGPLYKSFSPPGLNRPAWLPGRSGLPAAAGRRTDDERLCDAESADEPPRLGAEHQFSHLWDMQHHTHDGSAPSHGFKVAIGR